MSYEDDVEHRSSPLGSDRDRDMNAKGQAWATLALAEASHEGIAAPTGDTPRGAVDDLRGRPTARSSVPGREETLSVAALLSPHVTVEPEGWRQAVGKHECRC